MLNGIPPHILPSVDKFGAIFYSSVESTTNLDISSISLFHMRVRSVGTQLLGGSQSPFTCMKTLEIFPEEAFTTNHSENPMK